MQETPVQFLSQEDPLEKGQATHSNILIWRNPWTVLFMRSQRVGHDWVTFTFTLGKMHVWNISCDYLKTLWKSEPVQPLSLNKKCHQFQFNLEKVRNASHQTMVFISTQLLSWQLSYAFKSAFLLYLLKRWFFFPLPV